MRLAVASELEAADGVIDGKVGLIDESNAAHGPAA